MKTDEEKQKISITTSSWVRGVVVVALAYGILSVSGFILALIASIVIASSIEPLTLWAQRHNLPRVVSVIFIYVFGALFITGFFYFLVLPLIGEVSAFIKTLTIYSNAVVNDSVLSNLFVDQNVFGGLDKPVLMTQLSSYLNSWSNFMSQGIFSSLATISGGVARFVLIIVLSFYLAVQDDGITKFLRIIVPIKHEHYVINLWKRSQAKIGRWMQGQIILAVLVMILVYLGLSILGIPHALLLSVIAGVFEIIPLFGPIFAAIPAVFVAYTVIDAPTAVIVGVLYLVIQQFENHIIYPLVVKKVIGIPPIVSIIALVVGGELAGFLGILIAVPVAAAFIEFFTDLEEEKLAKISAMSIEK